MKTLTGLGLTALVAGFLAGPALAVPASTVTIDLAGLKGGTGDLYVSLQTREQYLKPTGSYGTIVAKPASGALKVTLPGVAPGVYSVSVWHDDNANRQFDRKPSGEPLDGWAMINGNTLRAAPVFEQTSFTVEGGDRAVSLAMIYGR